MAIWIILRFGNTFWDLHCLYQKFFHFFFYFDDHLKNNSLILDYLVVLFVNQILQGDSSTYIFFIMMESKAEQANDSKTLT